MDHDLRYLITLLCCYTVGLLTRECMEDIKTTLKAVTCIKNGILSHIRAIYSVL